MSEDQKGSSSAATLWAAVITGVLGFAGAILAAMLGVVPSGVLPKETVTVTATHTITVDPSQGSEPPTATTTGSVFLSDLKPVEGALDKKSVSWQEKTFPHSLVNPLSGCSAVGPIDWVIPTGSKIFRSEIGVDLNSPEAGSKVTFIVYLDGSRIEPTKTLPVGAHEPLQIALTGHQRLRLETVIDENRRNTCSMEALAVWGDARFAAS